MSDDSRYGLYRGLFMTLCATLIVVGGVRSCSDTIASHQTAPQVVSSHYQRRFCDDETVLDYSKKTMERITIPLTEGCYGPRVIVPEAWQTFEIQKSQNPGDYVSVWCNGRANPGPLVPFSTAGTGGALENSCFASMDRSANFHVQGKGTLTLICTQPKFGAHLQDSPLSAEKVRPQVREEAPAPKEQAPERTYAIQSLLPSSGADSDYRLMIDECHRSFDKIHCSGRAVNTLDVPKRLYLKDAHAVDDRGNSIAISSAQFQFPGGTQSDYSSEENLLPNVPTKFTIVINDPDPNVMKINLQLSTYWENGGKDDDLIYAAVSVQ